MVVGEGGGFDDFGGRCGIVAAERLEHAVDKDCHSEDPLKQLYRFTSCYLQGKADMLPLAAFGFEERAGLYSILLTQGCWPR